MAWRVSHALARETGEYVMCNMCKSLETVLNRDDVSRLWFMNCKACGSRRSVPPIKAGFHAVNRRDRRADRQKQ
jgi:translation initiation factor 2 subunit 2